MTPAARAIREALAMHEQQGDTLDEVIRSHEATLKALKVVRQAETESVALYRALLDRVEREEVKGKRRRK